MLANFCRAHEHVFMPSSVEPLLGRLGPLPELYNSSEGAAVAAVAVADGVEFELTELLMLEVLLLAGLVLKKLRLLLGLM
jgi:hypothetical protein